MLLLFCYKVWIQTGKTSEWLRNEYTTAVEGIKERLIRRSVTNGLTFVGELHGTKFSPKMVCHYFVFLILDLY